MGIFDGIRAAIAAGKEKAEKVTRQRMAEEIGDFLDSAVGGQENLDVLVSAKMSLFEAVPVILRTREGAGWLKRKRIAIDIGDGADIPKQLIEKVKASSFGVYLKSADIDSAIDGFGVIIEEAGFKVPPWYLKMCLEDFQRALRA
ncbi:MAG: hypothetical protein WC551_09660 [Patescibacteria group bacterium]